MENLYPGFLAWWFNWGALSVFVVNIGIIAYLFVEGATTPAGTRWAGRAAILCLPSLFALLGPNAALPSPVQDWPLAAQIVMDAPLVSACAPIFVLLLFLLFGRQPGLSATSELLQKTPEVWSSRAASGWVQDAFEDMVPGGNSSPATGSKLRG